MQNLYIGKSSSKRSKSSQLVNGKGGPIQLQGVAVVSLIGFLRISSGIEVILSVAMRNFGAAENNYGGIWN